MTARRLILLCVVTLVLLIVLLFSGTVGLFLHRLSWQLVQLDLAVSRMLTHQEVRQTAIYSPTNHSLPLEPVRTGMTEGLSFEPLDTQQFDNSYSKLPNIREFGESPSKPLDTPQFNSTVSKRPEHQQMEYFFGGRPEPPLTLHTDYIIDQPDLCPPGVSLDYVMLVHTAVAHWANRQAIRATFGNHTLSRYFSQRVVFLVGVPDDSVQGVTADSLQQEATEHGDIVQGTFVDSYHNLTLKAIMGLRWVAERCSLARFVLKTDDDVFINLHRLMNDVLPAIHGNTRTIVCKVVPEGKGEINRRGKWAIDKNFFRGLETYPFNMCNGFFVVMTSDLVRPMLRAAEEVPSLWIDDVYVYGMLANHVGGVNFTGGGATFAKDIEWARDCFRRKGFMCAITVLNSNSVVIKDLHTWWYYCYHNINTTPFLTYNHYSVTEGLQPKSNAGDRDRAVTTVNPILRFLSQPKANFSVGRPTPPVEPVGNPINSPSQIPNSLLFNQAESAIGWQPKPLPFPKTILPGDYPTQFNERDIKSTPPSEPLSDPKTDLSNDVLANIFKSQQINYVPHT